MTFNIFTILNINENNKSCNLQTETPDLEIEIDMLVINDWKEADKIVWLQRFIVAPDAFMPHFSDIGSPVEKRKYDESNISYCEKEFQ